MTHHRESPHETYLGSDTWKCQPSPSGAHHWVERSALSTDSGTYRCVHCREKRAQEDMTNRNPWDNRSGV